MDIVYKNSSNFELMDNKEFKHLYNEMLYVYETLLKGAGIKKFPKQDSNSAVMLATLYKYKGQPVPKDLLTKNVWNLFPEKNSSGDQAARHLANEDGYNILVSHDTMPNGEKLRRGYYMMLNFEEPKTSWLRKQLARIEKLNVNNFEELKEKYNNCCATCGGKEGSLHKVTMKKIVLQKGHMNPNKELTINNCIPQCQYCNEIFGSDNFVFDKYGYIRELNNPQYIVNHTCNDVKDELLSLLSKKHKTANSSSTTPINISVVSKENIENHINQKEHMVEKNNIVRILFINNEYVFMINEKVILKNKYLIKLFEESLCYLHLQNSNCLELLTNKYFVGTRKILISKSKKELINPVRIGKTKFYLEKAKFGIRDFNKFYSQIYEMINKNFDTNYIFNEVEKVA